MNKHNENLINNLEFVKGKVIIGIDPAKDKHQARVLDRCGIPLGKSFSFKNNFEGFHKTLWKRLNQIFGEDFDLKTGSVFAIESACDLWQQLVHCLYREGYYVVRVSPLHTYHSRVQLGNDFSKTDPKDALIIANNSPKPHSHATCLSRP